MDIDRDMMARALDLAILGKPFAGPRPSVGAVITNRGRIVGQGFYRGPGALHAEAEALFMAGKHAKGGTLYVTLEPHCYHGTQPPCTDRIIEAGIKRAVIASLDPNPRVNGNGVKQLIEAGIDVSVGLLEAEAKAINPGHFKCHELGIPYVVLKIAVSLDGFMADSQGKSKWLSCEESLDLVHRMRGEFCSVSVGIGTVLADDPLLTPRRVYAPRPPVRIILDSSLRIPLSARVLDQSAQTILITTDKADENKIMAIQDKGHDVWVIGHELDMELALKMMAEAEINSVLFEGGVRIARSLLEGPWLDELRVCVAPKVLGGGLSPFPGPYDLEQTPGFKLQESQRVGRDMWLILKKER
ncbi:MAG: bifunctional diaminohydroxyphosphoribosylaminopyrimidine deaminase/5-amino-6-(5-phosphoribosylamino)uracil reductase RibD [candidate division WOR-3 bacterium]